MGEGKALDSNAVTRFMHKQRRHLSDVDWKGRLAPEQVSVEHERHVLRLLFLLNMANTF